MVCPANARLFSKSGTRRSRSGGNHWRIVNFIDGKRSQLWFKNEKEAKSAAADKNVEIAAYGTQATLSVAGRVRAINATERLAPLKKLSTMQPIFT